MFAKEGGAFDEFGGAFDEFGRRLEQDFGGELGGAFDEFGGHFLVCLSENTVRLMSLGGAFDEFGGAFDEFGRTLEQDLGDEFGGDLDEFDEFGGPVFPCACCIWRCV